MHLALRRPPSGGRAYPEVRDESPAAATRSVGLLLGCASLRDSSTSESTTTTGTANPFARLGLKTDACRRSVDLERFASGGPPKDGIPALVDPSFVSVSESKVATDVRGILVSLSGDTRFYPLSILVWHEVVNDTVGGTPIAVTFCPLCGSGIVFDRTVDGDSLEFGVSGLLFESNLVTYDRKTESLWSQSRGEALVGRLTGAVLGIMPMQLLTKEQVATLYPGARVLSQDTGYERDYRRNPYAGYADTEDLFAEVGHKDQRFPLKEPMYVFRLEGTSYAFALGALPDSGAETVTPDGRKLLVRKDRGEVYVTADDEPVPGYVEMWFSWAVQHREDGVVWLMDASGINP